jgi:broad specificity phosphatase PhoE
MPSHPSKLWVVRHGESAGNVALAHAERLGLATIEIEGRDIDVPLSSLGRDQAGAVGEWFRVRPEAERFTAVLSSPYARARETAALIVERSGSRAVRVVVDERLREKEFGSLNRLTKAGILQAFPEEADRRTALGKFYYRPPAGESWCDVILRLRSLVDHVQLRYSGERVLLVAHQVIVLCFRYLLENLDETAVLAIDREGEVANCSVTTFEATKGANGREEMVLRSYNAVTPMEATGTSVTRQPDPAVKT